MKKQRGRPRKEDKIIRINLSITKETQEDIKYLKDGQRNKFSKIFNLSKSFSEMIRDKRRSIIKI